MAKFREYTPEEKQKIMNSWQFNLQVWILAIALVVFFGCIGFEILKGLQIIK